MSTLDTFEAVIKRWPTKSAMADDLGTLNGKRAHVREWSARKRIPAKWFDRIVEAAHRRGFVEITYLALTDMLHAVKATASADEAI